MPKDDELSGRCDGAGAASFDKVGERPMLEEIADWLRNEAEERMKKAMAREQSAGIMRGATPEELRAAKRTAEQMHGRRLPAIKATVEDAQQSASVDERIAAKLDTEGRQLSAWADYLAALASQTPTPPVGPTSETGSIPAGARDDYNERFELAKQRIAIVERVMKLGYIKQTRNTEEGQIRFIARDDVITAIHNVAKVSRAADCGPHPDDNRALAANASTPTVCPAGPVVEGELRARLSLLQKKYEQLGAPNEDTCLSRDVQLVYREIGRDLARAALTNDPPRETKEND